MKNTAIHRREREQGHHRRPFIGGGFQRSDKIEMRYEESEEKRHGKCVRV